MSSYTYTTAPSPYTTFALTHLSSISSSYSMGVQIWVTPQPCLPPLSSLVYTITWFEVQNASRCSKKKGPYKEISYEVLLVILEHLKISILRSKFLKFSVFSSLHYSDLNLENYTSYQECLTISFRILCYGWFKTSFFLRYLFRM